MAVYSVGRRRIIIVLLLSSILLVTLDLRGNAVFDSIRTGVRLVVAPVETAADVITQPVVDAWRGITEYDDLIDENRRLQEQLDSQRGAEIAARNAIVENQRLLELNDLQGVGSIPTVTSQVIGSSPNNFDQVIEIDRGSLDGIGVGMAVVNEAGLVGKVTRVFPSTALVQLMLDRNYAVQVKVLSLGDAVPPSTPPDTVPSGLDLEDVTTTTSTTTTTAPDNPFLDDPLAPPDVGATTPPTSPATGTTTTTTAPTEAAASVDGSTTTSSTTTTTEPTIDLDETALETGLLEGRGRGQLPVVTFLVDNPTERIELGDAVYTTGGRDSLAPPNIPVGVVVNRIERAGVGGLELEVEPNATFSSLQFVRVLIYRPPSEIGE